MGQARVWVVVDDEDGYGAMSLHASEDGAYCEAREIVADKDNNSLEAIASLLSGSGPEADRSLVEAYNEIASAKVSVFAVKVDGLPCLGDISLRLTGPEIESCCVMVAEIVANRGSIDEDLSSSQTEVAEKVGRIYREVVEGEEVEGS